MQMLILNQPRLKTRLFSNTVSSNNDVFKGKVFKQNETNTTNWKSHQENFDSQTKLRLTKNPTITCRVLTISHNIVSTSYCSRLHNVKSKRDKRTAKKSVKVQAVLEDDTLNNKPIHFGVYKTITRLLDHHNFGLVITCNIKRYLFFTLLRLIMKDFLINKP